MSRFRPTSRIDELIIHCSATPNGQWFDVADIDRWHVERGFERAPDFSRYSCPRCKAVGYHYVIYTTGGVMTGRATNETGAHARGHNSRSLGICLIGMDKFTPAQWESLTTLVRYWRALISDLAIIGHRQVNNKKTCPGFDVDQWLAGGMQPLDNHLLPGALA